MPTDRPSSSANILAPGLIAALLLFLACWANALQAVPADYVRAELTGYASMLLILAGTEWFALHRLLRASEHGPRFSPDFLKRMLHACLVAAIAAGGLGLAMWVYYAEVDPGYLQRFLAMYESTLLSGDLPARELERRQVMIEANRNFLLSPFKQAMLQAGTALAIGILTAPVAALASGMTSGITRSITGRQRK